MQPRRFQFRLSTIFVLMLVIAAFFGGVVVQRLETERVRQEWQVEMVRGLQERARALAVEARYRAEFDELHRRMELQSQAQPSKADADDKPSN